MLNSEGWTSNSTPSSPGDLQQALRVMQQERDIARQAEQNWRARYEMEAHQRRADAAIAQQAIARLQAEIQRLTQPTSQPTTSQALTALPQEFITPQTLVDLQAKLIQVGQERDQLQQLLEVEKANHGKTRASLTTTLCDAMEALNLKRES